MLSQISLSLAFSSPAKSDNRLVQMKRLPLSCGEFEVRVLISAPSQANFKFKNHTRFIELLVSLMIPKYVQSLPK